MCSVSPSLAHRSLVLVVVTLPPDLSSIIQPSNQKSSQSNTNTSVRVFIDELNFCTLLEGDKLQVQWIVNIVHLRILHSKLMIPRWRGNTIYLLRGPSFNSVGAGSWPVTRHVRASRGVTRRHVTCPRHPQHHVSIRVTVRTAPPPSLMYYYLNSCLITHYTLHVTRYTLHVTRYKHFLLWHCDKWRVILLHSDLNIHYPGVLGWPTLGLSE